MEPGCRFKEVSLRDALLNAHQYSALAGESPAQDAAMLRLLIAVAYTVFYRTDENGQPAVLRDAEDALDRWEAIWHRGSFPEAPVRSYLEQWRPRLDLLDSERPFFQVPEAAIGTPHTSAKLNGMVLQSENKLRIFAGRTEASLGVLTLAEAARWLVYLQAFDDASVKPKTTAGKQNVKSKPGSARGWLGNLGVLYAVGDSLFETILLNTVFLKDGEVLYAEPKPCWELERLRTGEYTVISQPDNLAELFTLQTRRVILHQENDRVNSYTEYCGDLLSTQDAFAEPMTVWRPIKKKSETVGYSPRPHTPSRQLWRDFSSVAVQTDENRLPGISNWLRRLQSENCLDSKRVFRFAAVSALYDSSGSSVTNTVSDTLAFHADLLSAAGHIWRKNIEDQIQFCDALAYAVGTLAGELAVAAGKREVKDKKPVPPPRTTAAEAAQAQFYFRIDAPFRQWLLRPRADQPHEEMLALINEWHKTALQIVRELGNELVDAAGEAAFLGRWAEFDDKKEHYSSAEAFRRFLGRTRKTEKGV